MNIWKKSMSFGITQKIDLHRLRRNGNNKQRSTTKNKRMCLHVDTLSLSDSDDSCLNSTSSSGDKGGGINHQRFILTCSVLRTLDKNLNR